MSAASGGAPHVALTVPMALGIRGGGTVGALQIARALRRAGIGLTVLAVQTHLGWTRPRPPIPPELVGKEREDELAELGARVVRVPARAHLLLDGLAMRAAVRELLHRERVDALIGFHAETLYLRRLLRARGVRHAAIAAGQYHDLLVPSLRDIVRDRDHLRLLALRLIARRVFGSAQTVFAISEYMKRVLVEVIGIDPGRVEVAYWGVDPVFASAARAAPERVTNLFFYGSSAPRKGIPDLIAALGRLAAAGAREWTLRLVVWDRETVKALAREHGVSDRVELLEPMDHRALVRQLEWAHVAILPSRYESFGLACAECQAAGLPVIAYDVGGVGEVVRHGETGWLVPLGDVAGLAHAIRDALADAGRARVMGSKGRERALATFTWDRTAAAILAGLGLR